MPGAQLNTGACVPLSDGNFIQQNTLSTTGTSHVVTLPSGTTAGNTIIAIFSTQISFPSAPTTAWVLDRSVSSSIGVYRLPDVAAAQTSWTFTTGVSASPAWYIVELSGLDLGDPFDATATSSGNSVTNGGTMSTGTSGVTAGLDVVAFAIFAVENNINTTWSGYTNSFTEVAEINGTGNSLAVACRFVSGGTASLQSTATAATTGGPYVGYAAIASYRAAGAPVVAPLTHFMGFEWGTNGGTNVTGATGPFGAQANPSGTWNTNYLIQAGSARNSSYGLRVVQSAGAAFVRCGIIPASMKTMACGFNVRVVSATGTVVVAEVSNSIGTEIFAQLLYDSSATKFGVRCSTTGTTQWESGTTALNTWRWVDWRFKGSATGGTWTSDWRIETGTDTYTDQTQATIAAPTGNFIDTLNLGRNAAQTMTADYDDVVMTRYWGAFPLGPHEVKILTVDPAGTPTISGTAANFGVFTGNTTVAAWNAVNARNAVDEVPPTISAAADGATQITVAASDYMEFPMATYTCTATEFINGVRMLAPMWSATSAAASIAIRGHDGTDETALATVAAAIMGAPTAVSATAPVWRCAMWPSTNGWTQTELNAAVLRVGWSGDATPDIGVEALYLEVAIGRTKTRTLFGDMATAEEDPTRLGKISVTVTAPSMGTGDTSLEYEEAGSPTTVNVPEGTVVTEQIGATFDEDVNRITMEWPPEPDPVD
jgi:hypothetical protein